MAEILGVGVTHSPSLITPDELKNYSLTRALRNERIPSEQKNPENWPTAMRDEWGDDEGYTSALYHREKLVEGFRKVRAELDAFNPDVVLVWGDDQYENFREDIIPAFCVMAYDEYECRPFTTKEGGARQRGRRPAQRLGRTRRQDLPLQGPSGGPPLGRRAAGRRVRRGLCLQAAARAGAGTRLPQYFALPGLRPHRLRLSCHPLRRQLLRQPGHSQPGRRKPADGQRRRNGRRPARPLRRSDAWSWEPPPPAPCGKALGAWP